MPTVPKDHIEYPSFQKRPATFTVCPTRKARGAYMKKQSQYVAANRSAVGSYRPKSTRH